MSEVKPDNKLWTKNFTIITLGSVVSMIGNSMTGFAMSLLVLDYTASSFYYAVYLVVYTLPQLFMPVLSGAILDRVSRRKTIYTLDFISSGIYLVMALLLGFGSFSFLPFLVFSFLIGSINSIYFVAYESFYPMLVPEGKLSKAYSIASVLEVVSTFMVPLAAFVYNLVGIVPLFCMNVCCFLLAAIMETRIDAKENYIDVRKAETAGEAPEGYLRTVLTDIREGFRYLLTERGLLMIAVYFLFSSMSGGTSSVIVLPYFKETFENGEYLYMIVGGLAMAGRAAAGAILYRKKLPDNRKFALALTSYIVTSLIEGFLLFWPLPLMMVLYFISGLLSVTSYTIRTSATQSYVPDEKKGRFNGAFNMLSTVGNLSGQMLGGALVLLMPGRVVLMAVMLLNALAAIVLIGGHKKEVKFIYERSV